MIKVILIEDEKPAADHLLRLLKDNPITIEIITVLSSVEQAVTWFKNNAIPDLAFLDIQLSDGLSFDIFNHLEINCPIIFTTAYEEYALKAFKLNSIDYLLKPINANDLNYALKKYKKLTIKNTIDEHSLKYRIDQVMHMLTRKYKERFVVNAGMHIRSIEVSQINYFYSLNRSTFLYENSGKSYDIDYSLEQLENLLDPKNFYRISRKYIVNINAIKDIISYSSNRLKIKMNFSDNDDIIVSRSRIKAFKQWL